MNGEHDSRQNTEMGERFSFSVCFDLEEANADDEKKKRNTMKHLRVGLTQHKYTRYY